MFLFYENKSFAILRKEENLRSLSLWVSKCYTNYKQLQGSVPMDGFTTFFCGVTFSRQLLSSKHPNSFGTVAAIKFASIYIYIYMLAFV